MFSSSTAGKGNGSSPEGTASGQPRASPPMQGGGTGLPANVQHLSQIWLSLSLALSLSFFRQSYGAGVLPLHSLLCFALGLEGWAGPILRSVEPHPTILTCSLSLSRSRSVRVRTFNNEFSCPRTIMYEENSMYKCIYVCMYVCTWICLLVCRFVYACEHM